MKWKTCTCGQWEEPRLYARATQIAQRDPDPRRRLFQPRRTTLEQPLRPLHPAATAIGPTVGGVGQDSSATSAWESDFSDHSEWERDWDDDADTAVSTEPAPLLPRPTSDGNLQPLERASPPTQDAVPSASSRPTSKRPSAARGLNIEGLVTRLRENHECSHEKWHWVKGPHQCEQCHFRLPSYIFECKKCLLQACNRCRRNRLR
jgi:hypothetical protein